MDFTPSSFSNIGTIGILPPPLLGIGSVPKVSKQALCAAIYPLVFTGVTRNSKKVLKDVTANIQKSRPLLETVEVAHDAFYKKNYDDFLNLMNESWILKKNTSDTILKNSWIKQMDEELIENKSVIAHKLCGAGNGGFFLTFSKKGQLNIPFDCVKIDVETNGVTGKEL